MKKHVHLVKNTIVMRLKYVGIFFIGMVLSCESDDKTDTKFPESNEPDKSKAENNPKGAVWSGAQFTFTQSSSNVQDKLTDKVWITRSNEGQIYNAVSEPKADKNNSPRGTRWAKGKANDWRTLKFGTFRATVGKPKEVLNQDLVLHLIEDSVYLDIKFIQWGSQKSGGFSYQRSSK